MLIFEFQKDKYFDKFVQQAQEHKFGNNRHIPHISFSIYGKLTMALLILDRKHKLVAILCFKE